MRLRNYPLLKWLLVVLFMFHYINGVFFTHVHVEGSRFVTHSHPYSNAQHQHSSADFSLIRSLSLAVTIAFAIVFASVFCYVMQIIVCKRDLFDYIRFYNPLAPLRAPPSC